MIRNYEVHINKSNGQPFVYLSKNSDWKDGDIISVKKESDISKEELEKIVNEDEKIQEFINWFKTFKHEEFKDNDFKLIKKIKNDLGIETLDSDGEMVLELKYNDTVAEFTPGEGVDNEFILFYNNGVGTFSEDYKRRMLEQNEDFEYTMKHTKNMAIIKIYTDLIESYHQNRLNEIRTKAYQIFCPIGLSNSIFDIKNVNLSEYWIYYNNLVIELDYVENSIVIKKGIQEIYL